jgi:arsenate reductase (thioredoxin)
MTTAGPTLSTEQRLLVEKATARLRDEFSGVFGPETIERFVGDSLARMSGARLTGFVPLFAERFTRERLHALAKVEGKEASTTPSVLFLCVHNAGRSQMAAGFLRHLGRDGVQVYSGGSDPASEVNAAAIDAMAEVGIDITTEFPKPWTDEVVRAADVVVTMGCGDACPLFPGKRYLDWVLDDPAGQSLESVRPIRDDIEQRVRALMDELGVAARE